MYKINAHNISGVRNQVNNPDWRVIMANYVCIWKQTQIMTLLVNRIITQLVLSLAKPFRRSIRTRSKTLQVIQVEIFSKLWQIPTGIVHWILDKHTNSIDTVCWLPRREVTVQTTVKHLQENEIWKILLLRLPLSIFLKKKNSKSESNCAKNLLFGVDFRLQIPPFINKIYTHKLSGEEAWSSAWLFRVLA